MKYRIINILFAVSLIMLINLNASAKSAAFGLFINESDNESLNYLEKILPNSFAGSLKVKYNFSIIKPNQISTKADDEFFDIKKDVKEENLHIVTQTIGADFFIFGSFKPLADNKIKVTISIFRKGTSSVFQFEDTGYLETEIFKLVDKITLQIYNIASESMIYKSDTIKEKSKLAILTNIEGDDLNSLYYEFLNTGYKISAAQGNEIHTLIDNNQINKFYHISCANASFHLIQNRKDIELSHGTWSGTEYYKKIIDEKIIIDQYTFNYQIVKNEILKKIKGLNSSEVDYLIIIGFNNNKTKAWIRCLNLKDNKLLVTESGIKGSSIDKIAKNIIKSMTTSLP